MDLNLPYEMDTRSPLSSYILAEEAEPQEFDPLMTSDGDDTQMDANDLEVLDFPEEAAKEECELDNNKVECSETRPVSLSMNGRITHPSADEGCTTGAQEPPSQGDSERHIVRSVERVPLSSFDEDGGDAFTSRDNSKSEESVSSDSSSGFRSGGYVSEDERPPEYSKVMQGVSVGY